MNNFLKDYLNCPCCGFILNDPRLLPCGHTYCHDCVFMFQSQIRCILCLENKSEHMEGNFPPNRLVAKMIQDTSNGLNRISNKHIDKLTEHIQSIEFELIELERIHKT